jgi:hypothetical protein
VQSGRCSLLVLTDNGRQCFELVLIANAQLLGQLLERVKALDLGNLPALLNQVIHCISLTTHFTSTNGYRQKTAVV